MAEIASKTMKPGWRQVDTKEAVVEYVFNNSYQPSICGTGGLTKLWHACKVARENISFARCIHCSPN